MQRRFVVLALTVCALGVGSSVALADSGTSGNSGNVMRCQENGWQQLRSATGGVFANQGDCVSYAAQGGILSLPTVTVTAVSCRIGTLDTTVVTIGFAAAGFTPSSSLNASVVDTLGSQAGATSFSPVTFDAAGSAVGQVNATFLTAESTFTGIVTITDGSGITTSATVLPTTCVAF